ncbi:hypothetical protein SAMN02910455_02092 [Acidaminococcus fermentans]|uniref:hypothetical protein n=1 Tax=Acidaminococcus fermentans TaxID=905 RepID=UPI0008EF5764|nr:hypothetical protein [Acidaminococcus fermentans]SFO79826.1 hypothetical protein SAMN02910455_02092 [Acidaminococcus fermentans]
MRSGNKTDGNDTTGTKLVKMVMVETHTGVQELAQLYGVQYQSMSNKMHRDYWAFADLQKALRCMGAELAVRMKDSGKLFY